jgi:NADH-quinone oxidoreductase subunit F
MAVELSPQIRILPGGEPRLLKGIGDLDPGSLAAVRKTGGYKGLTRSITKRSPEEVIAEVSAAGLRGRGGAGFPVADKWRAARSAPGDRKIVVANLMGADPTSLGDRTLAEGKPHLVLEGAIIAAAAVGASEAILAVRRDWTLAIERLKAAVADAEAANLAGYLILGTDVSVNVSVWEGSGAYVAGEETALIHALQGDRGMPLIRPPYPAERGLWGVPTVVHNAETLAHVAWIAGHSAAEFAKLGTRDAPGTKLVTIAGAVRNPGLSEVALGTSVDKLIGLAGGSTGTVKAAFIGGPGAGALAADELGGTAYDYGALGEAGGHIGSGSVLVTDAGTCMVATARFLLDFSAREACGKAVPCRIGTRRLVEALDRILAATPRPNDLVMLRELSMKIADTALCRLESLAPRPMLTTLDRFGDEYRAHAERGVCLAGSCSTDAVLPLLAPLAEAGGLRAW